MKKILIALAFLAIAGNIAFAQENDGEGEERLPAFLPLVDQACTDLPNFEFLNEGDFVQKRTIDKIGYPAAVGLPGQAPSPMLWQGKDCNGATVLHYRYLYQTSAGMSAYATSEDGRMLPPGSPAVMGYLCEISNGKKHARLIVRPLAGQCGI